VNHVREYTVCGCPMIKHYTLCHDFNKDIALLFESKSVDEVGAIPELEKIFPTGYSVRGVGKNNPSRWEHSVWKSLAVPNEGAERVLVSATPLENEPDKAKIDDRPLVFYFGGKRYDVSLRERYNACLSLFKAFGCNTCPDHGLKCLGQAGGFEIPDRFYDSQEEELVLDTLEKHHQTMGGFEFVHPSATRVKNEFTSTFRKYWEHSFEFIDQNASELSDRAEKAAASRRFKKEQCSKCVIKTSCEAYRHCKGAYPPVEDIIKQSIEEFQVVLAKSAWPEWQLWEIARNMGASAKHSRWNIFLAGLTMHGSSDIVPSVKRAKLEIKEYGGVRTYAEIAEAFGLAKTAEDAVGDHHGPITDPGLRATFWLALNTRNAYHRYGWGSSEHMAGLGITNRHVTVRWTNGKQLRGWADLTSVADVAKHLSYGRLAHIQKIETRFKET
jgi:hypothetical protein